MADLTLNELAAKCAEQAQEIERCRKAVQPHPEQMGGAGWKLDASIPTADKVEAYAEIMDDELKAISELLAGANEDLLALRAQLSERDACRAALKAIPTHLIPERVQRKPEWQVWLRAHCECIGDIVMTGGEK
jgi:hypothetical protein